MKQNKKVVKDMYRYLTLEDTWLENKHMKRCSRSYVIRKVQIKATRYHGTPIRMAKIWDTDNANTDEED